MTTELEKQFFDTFGIEPNTTGYELKQVKENARGLIRVPVSEYPQITDRQYLELICVLSNYWVETSKRPYLVLLAPNLGELKENVLSACILHKIYKSLYNQVQAIFEGER